MDIRQTILIVDDTPENLRVLGDLLEEDYEVRVASNGREALETVKSSLPDLILLDIVMPGMGGYEVCRQLKADPEFRIIPVIFISALGMAEQKVQAFREGAVDYITKPFQAEEVVARVHTHLQLSKMEDLKREIAERKQAEKLLQESERRLRDAQRVGKLGSLDWNLETNKIILSEEALAIYGLDEGKSIITLEEIVGRVHPDDKERVGQGLNSAIANRERYNMEHRVIRPDGTERSVHAIAELFLDPAGKPVRLLGTIQDITERKFAEGRLKTSREQLHLLAGHLQSVREEERKLLAQEFHDQLGQTLTAIKMDLSMLHRAIADPGKEPSRSVIAQGIESSQDMIDRAIAIIREILSELRPELLDQLGIVPTLEWEVERFQRKSGISCTFSSSVEAIALDAKIAIAVYRIFQEAITNVARHAKATSVAVSLRKEGPYLVLETKDNGVGISADAEKQARSFGLISMRERTILLGGTIEISGVEGKGTTVLVRIPYEQTLAGGGAAL